jgi:tetratricopeptide (TPR) repeat protein
MRALLILITVALLASCQSKQEKLREEIRAGESKLFNDTVKMLNAVAANETYNKYILYADTYKDDSAANYLFRAADLTNGLRRPKESITIYERIRKDYPNFNKAAACLFMEGFLYETALNDKENAKIMYKQFIDMYPKHQLTPSAQASLDQLNSNMTDEELIRKFEAMQGDSGGRK